MSSDKPVKANPQQPAHYQSGLPAEGPVNEWAALGTAFEGLCKAGLALTIGFSVAAAFCRMVDSGKLKVPAVLNQLSETMAQETATGRKREKE